MIGCHTNICNWIDHPNGRPNYHWLWIHEQ